MFFFAKNRFVKIWENDNYLNIIEQVVTYIYEKYDEHLPFMISSYLEMLLSYEDKSEKIIDRIDKWLTMYIDKNYDDEKKMSLLFSFIEKITPERRKKYIIHFAKLNISFEAFKQISLEESGYGGIGSMIPYMEEKISFLKSLLPDFSGVQYLYHKERVMRAIEVWERQIENEQVREMLMGMSPYFN